MRRGIALALVLAVGPALAEDKPADTCLMLADRCVAKGSGNFYLYYKVSEERLALAGGDRLEYDVFLDPDMPVLKGGVDIQLAGGGNLRDSGAVDQDANRAHGDAILDKAKGQWFHRSIDMSRLAGQTTERWDLVFEGDPAGLYIQFVDDIVVTRADGTKRVIYGDGRPSKDTVDWKEGYSKEACLAVVPRTRVAIGEGYHAFLDETTRSMKLLSLARERRDEIDLVEEFLKREKRDDLLKRCEEAKEAIPDAAAFKGTSEEYEKALHATDGSLAEAGEVVRKYTGHLVGYGHIDILWLWDWPETIDATRATFGQALRFMEEFPEFKYTHSCACLYQAMEEHDPDLFKRIQQRVKEGRWEIVGGRWCEGDTNMISSESHARHFLYAQRYFREKFGVTARVGWEPDTFGHCWQMPQMLKLAGIDSYFFCRGGKGHPLFDWEGIDGTRVLAFEAAAIPGAWYGGDVGPRRIEQALQFHDKTGSRDMLWVYGVGNHGGGPTKENIEAGVAWQKEVLPQVKFDTAGEYFDAVRKGEHKELPVVKDELNPVFEGSYTTHGDLKRWNADAESLTVAAEAAAVMASTCGYKYPREELKHTWEDILWNHHHDTLEGTGIHSCYTESKKRYEAGISSSKRIMREAATALASQVKNVKRGDVLVLNPLGWTRDVLVYLPDSGELRVSGEEKRSLQAIPPNGDPCPIQSRDAFVAKDLPAFGYRVYRIEPCREGSTWRKEGWPKVNTECLEITLDPESGMLARLYDKSTRREALTNPGNLLEVSHEASHDGSAWTIGAIRGVEVPSHKEPGKVVETGPVFARFRTSLGYDRSTIAADVLVYKDFDYVEFNLDVDWQEKGSKAHGSPFLRVSFPIAARDAKARYGIPFGDIERAMDGREVPALQWADISGTDGGAALLTDCKHGFSAKDGTLTLSLIRASYDPDPEPDLGHHFIRYAIYPHAGSAQDAHVAQRAMEFNTPPIAVWCEDGKGDLPMEKSFLSVEGALPTALKLSEDSDDWVVRFYNPANTPTTVSLPGVAKASEVNFLEDPLHDADPSKVPLRGYEIKTLKLGH